VEGEKEEGGKKESKLEEVAIDQEDLMRAISVVQNKCGGV
jgi:hypothetical protein